MTNVLRRFAGRVVDPDFPTLASTLVRTVKSRSVEVRMSSPLEACRRTLERMGNVLMRKGLTNAEIGDQMSITERTVKGHVTGILDKLGAHDRAGAVARGFDLGLLKASGRGGD